MKLIFTSLAFMALAGCDLANDCSENPNLACYVSGAGAAGGDDGVGAAGGAGPGGGNDGEGGGGGGPAPQACDRGR